jgi:homoserine O-acetyltransferase
VTYPEAMHGIAAVVTAPAAPVGLEAVQALRERFAADPAARDAALRRQAAAWAYEFDPNSLVALRKAMVGFDAVRDFAKIRAKVLYVLSRTDRLFPPSLAPGVMAALAGVGVPATYVEIDSELGHVASDHEWAQWGPALRAFLDELR